MNARLNDALRRLASFVVSAVGVLLAAKFRLDALLDPLRRAMLTRELRIAGSTPIERWGPELEARIDGIEAELRSRRIATWRVETSGSTHAPKRLLYTKARVRERHWSFFEGYARVLGALGVRRRSFFVMAAVRPDRSLTSLLLTHAPKLPARIACLQTPYVLEQVPELRELGDQYGESALRLWLLVVSQPGMLYATNPSTIAAFVDAVSGDWLRTSALCRDWVREPGRFSPRVHACYRKVESQGALTRLEWIAGLDQIEGSVAGFFSQAIPALEVVSSWDGGYVGPFLAKLKTSFSARFAPMYSMSTEVVETRPVFSEGRVAFLPLVPGVLHEFVAEHGTEVVFGPSQLETGREYVLLVSDRFGLRRYFTEDVFVCRGRVLGLPDLAFVRRCGLSYSFTGEKITGEQVQSVIESLLSQGAKARTWAEAPASFAVFPSIEPHYELVQIGGSRLDQEASGKLLVDFERELSVANSEFKSKRESGRLGPTRYRHASIEQVAETLMPGKRQWESQFKFLPLYSRPFTARVEA